jgi:hypothetical protein
MISDTLIREAAAAANVTVPPDTDEEKGTWVLLLQAVCYLGERRLESALRDARDAEGPGMASRGEAAIALLRQVWADYITV